MADNQKQKKENFFKRTAKSTATYAKATKSELKKVSWPTPKQLVNNTIIVIVCVVVVGVFIALLDLIFSSGFNFFLTREPSTDDSQLEVSTEISTDSVESETALDELVEETDEETDAEETSEEATDEE